MPGVKAKEALWINTMMGGAPTERVVELVGIFGDVAAPAGRSTATIISLPSP